MYQLDQNEMTNSTQLTATAADPAALLETGLRGVLAAVHGDRPPISADSATAVPIQGTGQSLEQVFTDLVQHLLDQLEEFRPGLDALRLDGLLRTDTGGYTAWGYLSGASETTGQAGLHLTLVEPRIIEVGGELQLTCELNAG